MRQPRIIMSYDDFTIFEFFNRYYALDESDKSVKEVFLTKFLPAEDIQSDVVDLGGSYDGISDDLEWALSFSSDPDDKVENLMSLNSMQIVSAF